MDLSGTGKVHVIDAMRTDSHECLTLLYLPLIGKDAYIVYSVFLSLNHKEWDQFKIMNFAGMNQIQFQKAREVLEEFGLVKTYYDVEKKIWLYNVYAPLNANTFFAHDSFGRLYMNTMGSKQYDEMKCHFMVDQSVEDSMMDVTKQLDVTRLDQWNQTKENVYQEVVPKRAKKYNFDFDTCFNGLDRIFPMRLRTQENLDLIAQLASIYGIDAKDMKKYIQRSVNSNTMVFNKTTLKNLAFNYRKVVKQDVKDPYSISPVQFLKNKQKGAPISEADQRLVESLCSNYNFSFEVVNILIEYCLNQTNQKFTKSYVEKVASSWARLQIRTKEEALNQVKGKKEKKNVPKWYENTESKKPSQEALQEALEIQKRLRGEK